MADRKETGGSTKPMSLDIFKRGQLRLAIAGDAGGPRDVTAVVAVVEDAAVSLPPCVSDAPQADAVRSPGEVGRGRRGDYPAWKKTCRLLSETFNFTPRTSGQRDSSDVRRSSEKQIYDKASVIEFSDKGAQVTDLGM